MRHNDVSPSAYSRKAVVSYWRKDVHEILVDRLGGLSLPRKSVVNLTNRPDLTIDVYHERQTTTQQLLFTDLPLDFTAQHIFNFLFLCINTIMRYEKKSINKFNLR